MSSEMNYCLLATLPMMNKLVMKIIPRLCNRASHVSKNQLLFRNIVEKLQKLQQSLQYLGANEVFSSDIPVYNFCHQVEGILLNISDFLDQYEDDNYSPPMIVTEVCIQQIHVIECQLNALENVLRELGNSFSSELLKVQDLTSYFNITPDAGEPNHLVYWPPLSLPTALQRSLTSPLTSYPPVLEYAVHGQWLQADASLRETPSDVHTVGPAHCLLHMATFWQNPFAISMLLNHRADIDAPTKADDLVPKGSTALHIAVTLGNAQIAKLLLCSGARTDVANTRGFTPAMLPTSYGCSEMFEDADELRELSLEMKDAAKMKDWRSLSKLMRYHRVPLNFRAPSDDPSFLVHYSAAAGKFSVQLLLVSAGASPLLRNADQDLPSEIAAKAGHTSLVRLLEHVERYYATHVTPDPPQHPFLSTQVYPSIPKPSAQPCVAVPLDSVLPRKRSISTLLRRRSSASVSSDAGDARPPSRWLPRRSSAGPTAAPASEGPSAEPRRRPSLLRLMDRLARRVSLGRTA